MTVATRRFGERTVGDWTAVALVAVVALVASLAGIGNDFAQDDLFLIRNNERIQDIWNWKEIVSSPFWPAPLSQDLYRPVTSYLLALEYGLGNGAPAVFRVVSYLLYAAAAIALFLLAARVLPRNVALGVALIFAAHPVHVEAVALGAGQAELVVGCLAVIMVIRYLDHRRQGDLRSQDWAVLGCLYVAACLTKEQGFVLPGLLVAADLCLVADSFAGRARRLWKGYAFLALLAALVLLLRRHVLGGDLAGTFTAEALQGLTVGRRALTMLRVVPQWARLLMWPAHLRVDYSPQEMVASVHFGLVELLGALLLVAAAAVAWISRRRAPAVTFGLVWCAVALFPVSNVLIPTGILLAERTLFLPSMGFLLAVGGVVAVFVSADSNEKSPAWHGLQTVCIVIVLAGVLRSAERQLVWRNEALLAVRSVQDAPRSFRTQRAYGDVLFQLGERRLALEAYERAILLAPRGSVWRVRNTLASHYRALEEWAPEVEQLEASLREEPKQDDAWGFLVAGELALGRYADAARAADAAMKRGGSPEVFRGLRALADSADRVSAPPGSVKIRIRTTPAGSLR